LKKQINEIYQKHTGQHIGIIEQTLDRDRFMSATEARDFGLVDDVIEQIPIKVVEMIKNDEKS
jgi:ATP-dependent Clp protease protease subunit